MAKYRQCPECGAINPPSRLACIKCGSDSLEFEKILDDTVPVQEEKQAPPIIPQAGVMVRICDCGKHNPMQSRKCSECGEDISDIVPTPETEAEQPTDEIHYVLSSLDGEYAYELVDNLTYVGRENKMQEYLASKQFVSRRHAEFLIEQGKLYIKNHSNTNFTFVNNDKLPDDKYTELNDGDEIGLGGKVMNGMRQDSAAYLMVRIGSCM